MKNKKLLSAVFCLLVSSIANANIAVIVNKNNNSQIDANTIKRVYLGKVEKFSNGQLVLPLTPAQEQIKEEFNTTIVGRSSAQVSAHWAKMVFTGKGTPPVEKSDESEVIDAVTQSPTAIGYVSIDALNERKNDVRVISF